MTVSGRAGGAHPRRGGEDATLVVMPTYDEVESLPLVLERLRAALPAVHVLVVDDSSPDGTGERAQALAARDPRLHVLHRPVKSGLASAYTDGFGWGLARGFATLVEMDADGSHRPEDVRKLLARLDGPDRPDLAIGSRWVAGGHVDGWSPAREALSRLGNLYIRLLLGMGIADATSGLRAYRSDFLRSSGILATVGSAGYGFQVEMTLAAHDAGGVIVEVPITFEERRSGTSKLSGGIFVEELALVTRRGIGRRLRPRTRRGAQRLR